MPRSRSFLWFALFLALLLPAATSAGTLEGPRTIPEGLLTRVWNALVQPLIPLWAKGGGTMDPDGGSATTATDGGGTMDPNGTANSDGRGTMDPDG